LLYVTFIESGTNIMGPSISAVLANNMSVAAAPWLGLTIAALGVWILFKTQLDVIEGMTRSITDILWTGSVRVRDWRGGDVRAVYYIVLSVIAIWGIVASMFVAPDLLLKIGANIAGIVFIVAAIHVLYVNTKLLPPALRPPTWRRCTLLAMVAFYGFFLVLVAKSFL
ncbi:MAG: hypothetical protein H7Y89_08330, partial [Steroidobacteraceae bacterium]|nr:hypothetical protein [Steroidobacteraceae bacterium]